MLLPIYINLATQRETIHDNIYKPFVKEYINIFAKGEIKSCYFMDKYGQNNPSTRKLETDIHLESEG